MLDDRASPHVAAVIISFLFKRSEKGMTQRFKGHVCAEHVSTHRSQPTLLQVAQWSHHGCGMSVTMTCQLCLPLFVGTHFAFLFVYLNLNGRSLPSGPVIRFGNFVAEPVPSVELLTQYTYTWKVRSVVYMDVGLRCT